MRKKILLSVAGFDPSGGAGVILDLQVFRSLGFQGTAIVTAMTSQNIQEVLEIKPLPASFVWSQYQALKKDFSWRGIKLGLAGGKALFPLVRRFLEEQAAFPRVIDPVFRSSSGAWFLEPESIPAFLKIISGRASIITPNLPEARLITRMRIREAEEMEKAARKIFELTGIPCLLKGGHLLGPVVDVLFTGQKTKVFISPRIPVEVHGTGCFLSASLLAYLSRGHGLEEACQLALRFTRKAIAKASKRRGRRTIFSFVSEV